MSGAGIRVIPIFRVRCITTTTGGAYPQRSFIFFVLPPLSPTLPACFSILFLPLSFFSDLSRHLLSSALDPPPSGRPSVRFCALRILILAAFSPALPDPSVFSSVSVALIFSSVCHCFVPYFGAAALAYRLVGKCLSGRIHFIQVPGCGIRVRTSTASFGIHICSPKWQNDIFHLRDFPLFRYRLALSVYAVIFYCTARAGFPPRP